MNPEKNIQLAEQLEHAAKEIAKELRQSVVESAEKKFFGDEWYSNFTWKVTSTGWPEKVILFNLTPCNQGWWDALGYGHGRGNLIEKMATHNLRVGWIGTKGFNASYMPPRDGSTCKLLELVQSGAISVTVLDQAREAFGEIMSSKKAELVHYERLQAALDNTK